MDVRKITEQHHYPGWIKRYPSLIYIHYILLRILFLRSRVCRRAFKELLQNLKKQDSIVLDAGCGEGQYLIPMVKIFQNLKFTGIDQNPYHVNFLKKLTKKNKLRNCIVEKADIEAHMSLFPSYDIVCMIGVLQYTSDPEKIINLIARSQTPGGKLLIYTPVKTDLHFGFYHLIRKKYAHYDDAQSIYQSIEESQLYEWISGTGYQVTHKEHHYGYFGTLGHEMMQTLIILITHWPAVLKFIPCLFFIILIPIFVSLQVVDSWIRSNDREQGNGLLLILQK